jgi:hypothetical protein
MFMDYDSLPDDIRNYQCFLERTSALANSRKERLNLEPRVLGHFNEWATRTIGHMFSKLGLTLKPATTARYCGGKFEIELGDVLEDGRHVGDFFDDEIYDAIREYEDKTPWVSNVEEHFDLPK